MKIVLLCWFGVTAFIHLGACVAHASDRESAPAVLNVAWFFLEALVFVLVLTRIAP